MNLTVDYTIAYRLGIPPEEGNYPGDAYSRRRENGMIIERNVSVPMRDGVRLLVDVLRPADATRLPVILTYSPYGKHSRKSVDMFDQSKAADPGMRSDQLSHYTVWEGPDPLVWCRAGFVVVNADSRGSWGSQGTLTFFSAQEAQDGYDLVEWLAGQPWSNGRVGMSGVSYLASSQWGVAATRPPSLKAINPWEGASDQYRDRSMHGGIQETRFRSWWLETTSFSRTRVEDVVEMATRHPFFDKYWEDRAPDLAKIEVPVYAVVGWGDQGIHTRGTIEGYKRASSADKWLEVHARLKWPYFYREESVRRQQEFFRAYLTDDALPFDRPGVSIEVRERPGEFTTRTEGAWPIDDAQVRDLYLDAANGALVSELPAGAAGSYASQDGRLVFDHRFDADTEVTGSMALTLWVQTDDADDLDLFVAIEKLDADGVRIPFSYQSMFADGPVALGWLRVSHRELDPERSTDTQPWHPHDRALPVPKGEPIEAVVEILPSSTLFRAGETLRLVVQGREVYPFHEETVATEHERTRNAGEHIVHSGRGHQSRLTFPVIPPR
ncbi:MAG TPA: CocE/NonD family hydrolase [Solirubrobacteraceae bacterium]|nr:CocE/NonD family hydrolase [Solirubrobacteraceae bacterium]